MFRRPVNSGRFEMASALFRPVPEIWLLSGHPRVWQTSIQQLYGFTASLANFLLIPVVDRAS
jgi:hypothetical protein